MKILPLLCNSECLGQLLPETQPPARASSRPGAPCRLPFLTWSDVHQLKTGFVLLVRSFSFMNVWVRVHPLQPIQCSRTGRLLCIFQRDTVLHRDAPSPSAMETRTSAEAWTDSAAPVTYFLYRKSWMDFLLCF